MVVDCSDPEARKLTILIRDGKVAEVVGENLDSRQGARN